MRLDKAPTHQRLLSHARDMKQRHMRELFANDAERFTRFSIQGPHIFLDYSKNRITQETIGLLSQLARDASLHDRMYDLFSGQPVNNTERRPALHTALRQPSGATSLISDPAIAAAVQQTKRKMADFVGQIHRGEYLGYTGKRITTLVSIGIGGSFLGPKMVTEALKPYALAGLHCHYVANIDGTDLVETLKLIDPETTLFLLQSKSFSTLETLENAQQTKLWLKSRGLTEQELGHHFISVTANTAAAIKFGIKEQHIFPMWDWVGGRYSLWSAIGLPIAFLLGMDHFEALLQGAHEMDQHFYNSAFEHNLPVLMALLGVWYNNYFGADSYAILPYDQYLQYLPAHLQQLDMESSGKRVDRNGEELSYQSGPVIWGGPGCNGQHAYHQLLHQGTRMIPSDFIVPIQSHNALGDNHTHLFLNCLSQSSALMQGKTEEEVRAELLASGMTEEQASNLAPHKVIAGNKPSNTLILERVTPASTGALIALYEHKVFVQGVLWHINSFDQWGVELGKTMSSQLFTALNQAPTHSAFDASTIGLLQRFKGSHR